MFRSAILFFSLLLLLAGDCFAQAKGDNHRKDSIRAVDSLKAIKIKKNDAPGIRDENGREIFTYVEQQPEFPGGNIELSKYIRNNIKLSPDLDAFGTVYVTFLITEEGKAINPKILKGIGEYYSEEVIRLVNNMPLWKPGKLNGKPVNVQYNLPVRIEVR